MMNRCFFFLIGWVIGIASGDYNQDTAISFANYAGAAYCAGTLGKGVQVSVNLVS